MKKLLGFAALAGAAYAGLAAYAAQQGRAVGDVAGDLINRATDTAERTADRLIAFAESLSEADDVEAEGPAVVDLTDEADVRGAASGER
jgi:hypothetical protein